MKLSFFIPSSRFTKTTFTLDLIGLRSSGSIVYFPTKVSLDFQTAETTFKRDISEQNGLTTNAQTFKRKSTGH